MSSMESLDKLQAELSGNVYGDAFHTLYKLSQDVNVEHAELMAQAMRYVRKERVEPLEAENAKLREEIEAAKHDLSLFSGELVASKLENAKLRELVRDMWEYIYIGTAQDGQSLHDRTRSLGIEASA